MIPSLLRLAEHKALSKITLSGNVLDLGGDSRSEYQHLIKGVHVNTVVNLDEKSKPDFLQDLEKVLPFTDESYDHTLLINVLEHIFNYRQLLLEAARVTKQGGTVVIVVPFLFPIHPSPNDYWRFSEEALRKECELAGLKVSEVTPLGGGVFAARYVMLDRLLPSPIRFASFYTARYGVYACDWVFSAAARFLGKKYDPANYALGLIAAVKKDC